MRQEDIDVLRSLRGRLTTILVLLAVAALASGWLMVALFRQSASAEIGEARAEAGQACAAIMNAYGFYTAGWQGSMPALDDAALRRDLGAVVYLALRNRSGFEGGLIQADAGSLAYAFPTYEGTGPKTDFPEAERALIAGVNRAALTEDRPQESRVDRGAQTLLVAACPLPGPIPQATAWTMTRVHVFAGRGYVQLMAGLLGLFVTVLLASGFSAALILTWSRHVGQIETALNAHDIADLPVLAPTGERELDRIVLALNEAGRQIEASRQRAEALSRRVATGERLAAIGRVAAGIAHEIRNPIAAMRLKAESARAAASVERKDLALSVVLTQVDRLDTLLRRLLTLTEHEIPHRTEIGLEPFLQACAQAHAELAAERQVALVVAVVCVPEAASANFDGEQMRRALDNLVLNAIEAAPIGSTIRIAARRQGERLILSVEDQGLGPPPALAGQLFEPFVTGRPAGTGLGLSIVQEVAKAHGGTARLDRVDGMTHVEIDIPVSRPMQNWDLQGPILNG